MIPRPHAFCLRCRVMVDAGQACDCGDARAQVGLSEEDGTGRIEEALLEVPQIDKADSAQRFALSMLIGPGAAAAVLAVPVLLALAAIGDTETVAWMFGVPYVLALIAWIAVFVWGELEARRPYYPGASVPASEGDPVVAATVESGSIEVVELRQDGARPRVIRDAIAVEPLVLRRPGQRIEVPAGRVRVELPDERLGPAPPRDELASSWDGLPPELRRAGRLYRARLGRGARVELLDGELDELGARESTFREAAEERARFVPASGRVRLKASG